MQIRMKRRNIINVAADSIYATIQKDPIYSLYEETRHKIKFINASDIAAFIRSKPLNYCDYVITFVVPGLREIYFNYIKEFPENERTSIKQAIKTPKLDFVELTTDMEYEEYYPVTDITEYDVMHLPLTKFAQLINSNKPISFNLVPSNIVLSITYEDYNFWNNRTQSIDKKFDNLQICK